MLQDKKNKLTVSILTKLRNGGMPLMGEELTGESDLDKTADDGEEADDSDQPSLFRKKKKSIPS